MAVSKRKIQKKGKQLDTLLLFYLSFSSFSFLVLVFYFYFTVTWKNGKTKKKGKITHTTPTKKNVCKNFTFVFKPRPESYQTKKNSDAISANYPSKLKCKLIHFHLFVQKIKLKRFI